MELLFLCHRKLVTDFSVSVSSAAVFSLTSQFLEHKSKPFLGNGISKCLSDMYWAWGLCVALTYKPRYNVIMLCYMTHITLYNSVTAAVTCHRTTPCWEGGGCQLQVSLIENWLKLNSPKPSWAAWGPGITCLFCAHGCSAVLVQNLQLWLCITRRILGKTPIMWW